MPRSSLAPAVPPTPKSPGSCLRSPVLSELQARGAHACLPTLLLLTAALSPGPRPPPNCPVACTGPLATCESVSSSEPSAPSPVSCLLSVPLRSLLASLAQRRPQAGSSRPWPPAGLRLPPARPALPTASWSLCWVGLWPETTCSPCLLSCSCLSVGSLRAWCLLGSCARPYPAPCGSSSPRAGPTAVSLAAGACGSCGGALHLQPASWTVVVARVVCPARQPAAD